MVCVGALFQALVLKGVNMDGALSQSQVNLSSNFQEFKLPEESRGLAVEQRVEFLCELLKDVEEVHRFGKGTVADDDLKIDIAIKFKENKYLIGFQVKSSETGAKHFVEENKEGVKYYYKGVKKEFKCPGVFWLNYEEENLVEALFTLQNWLSKDLEPYVEDALKFYLAVLKKHRKEITVSLEKVQTKLSSEQIQVLQRLGCIKIFFPRKDKYSMPEKYVQFILF